MNIKQKRMQGSVIIAVLVAYIVGACTINRAYASVALMNYGDKNTPLLAKKYHDLKTGQAPKGTQLKIVQFGDSHTASDTFTGHLRALLRAELGNAGIGWITPMNVAGQTHQLVSFSAQNWVLTNSRNHQRIDYPMGGYIATPLKKNAKIQITSREEDGEIYTVTFLVKKEKGYFVVVDALDQQVVLSPKHDVNQWDYVTADLKLPISIIASGAQAGKIGGIWLDKKDQSGAQVSPIGTNGIRQNSWNNWNSEWLQQLAASEADVVMIAYGTNESFDQELNVEQTKGDLIKGIRQVREALPNVVIILLGAPDVIDKKSRARNACGSREPQKYSELKKIQLAVAKEEQVILWDWQQAMGGACQMEKWYQQKLVAADLVHFTNAGYKESATRFYQDISEHLEILSQPKVDVERIKVVSSKDKRTNSLALKKSDDPNSIVAIQIGSYRDLITAKKQANLILRRVKKGKVSVSKSQELYRALLTDFTLKDAVAVCAELKKDNVSCIIVRDYEK